MEVGTRLVIYFLVNRYEKEVCWGDGDMFSCFFVVGRLGADPCQEWLDNILDDLIDVGEWRLYKP